MIVTPEAPPYIELRRVRALGHRVLGLATAELESSVVPTTAFILLALFAVQRRGTARLGSLFGPVMLLWFATIAALGAYHVVHSPAVLAAVSPLHAARYFSDHRLPGITILRGVILCVTGGEALYADMGDLAALLPQLGVKTPSQSLLYVVGHETFVARGTAAWAPPGRGYLRSCRRMPRARPTTFACRPTRSSKSALTSIFEPRSSTPFD
jgi:hypothetical protein